MHDDNQRLSIAAERLAAAARVAVFTGAGVSAESGVPTFRDARRGLWARYDPQQLATPEAFAADPRLVWTWYVWRRRLIAEAHPNAAHAALAELERGKNDYLLITQNVDGLHQRAGSRRLVELHGNIHRNRCLGAGHDADPAPDDTREPPHCPYCGALLRPDVVWFGELLPERALETALTAARRCDLFLCVGTSNRVYPAAQLPDLAREAGATLIEVNVSATALSPAADFSLRGTAGELLPPLVTAALSAAKRSRI